MTGGGVGGGGVTGGGGGAAAVIVPVVLVTIVPQQFTGSAYAPALLPASVYPVNVMRLFAPASGEVKFALAPGPATSVTPTGLPFSPDRVVVVVPSNALSPPAANTSMRWLNVAPSVRVNFVE